MYTSPNYAKGGKGGGSVKPDDVIGIVESSFLAPVYEPVVIPEEFLWTISGDIIMAKATDVPLTRI